MKQPSIDALEKVEKLDYKFSFTGKDIVAVSNYIASNTIKSRQNVGGETIESEICQISELDYSIFGLHLGITELDGQKVTDENFDELLWSVCENPLVIRLLYYDMYGKALKKK